MDENPRKIWSLVDVKSHSQLAAKSVIVVDVAAMIWTLDWPSISKAKVHDLINPMNRTVGYLLKNHDVYTMIRTDSGSRVHKLHLNAPPPAKLICLSVSKNKEQLYQMFFDNLTNPDTAPDTLQYSLVVIGSDSVQFKSVVDNKCSGKI